MGAFRRFEIPLDQNSFWLASGGDSNIMFVKMPRKNTVAMVESEQAKLTKLIQETRDQIKEKTR